MSDDDVSGYRSRPQAATGQRLTIRAEQLAVFRDASRQSFEDRMAASVAADYPDRFRDMGDAGIRQFINRAIQTGRQYGIETEGAIAVLIQLMIYFGEQFELSPDRDWAFEMLAHPVAPPVLRISLVRDRLLSRSQGRMVTQFRPQE